MAEMTQIQRMYNALLVRDTRSGPTFAEVASDFRRETFEKIDIQTRF